MKNAKELATALLAAAEQAANGKANIEQIGALCQCSDALVRLARLQLDATAWKKPLLWLEVDGEVVHEASPEPTVPPRSGSVSARVQDLEREIAAAEVQKLSSQTSATMRRILEEKIQKWQEKIEFLNKTKGKVLAE